MFPRTRVRHDIQHPQVRQNISSHRYKRSSRVRSCHIRQQQLLSNTLRSSQTGLSWKTKASSQTQQRVSSRFHHRKAKLFLILSASVNIRGERRVYIEWFHEVTRHTFVFVHFGAVERIGSEEAATVVLCKLWYPPNVWTTDWDVHKMGWGVDVAWLCLLGNIVRQLAHGQHFLGHFSKRTCGLCTRRGELLLEVTSSERVHQFWW